MKIAAALLVAMAAFGFVSISLAEPLPQSPPKVKVAPGQEVKISFDEKSMKKLDQIQDELAELKQVLQKSASESSETTFLPRDPSVFWRDQDHKVLRWLVVGTIITVLSLIALMVLIFFQLRRLHKVGVVIPSNMRFEAAEITLRDSVGGDIEFTRLDPKP